MSYREGVQIGNALSSLGMGIGSAINRQRANQRQSVLDERQDQIWQRQTGQWEQQDRYEETKNQFYAALSQDPNYTPEKLDATTAPAWHDASFQILRERLAKAELEGATYELQSKRLQSKIIEGNNLAKKMRAAPEGTPEKQDMALEWYSKYYDNGYVIEKAPGSGKLIRKSLSTGETQEMPAISPKQIEKIAEEYYGKQGLPQKRAIAQMFQVKSWNNKRYDKRQIYQDGNGMIIYQATDVYDPEKQVFSDYYYASPPPNDTPLTAAQVSAMGFDWNTARDITGVTPVSEKEKAEIGLKKAQTAKTQAETEAIKRGGADRGSTADLKTAAWKKYLGGGQLTKQEKQLINVSDPYMSQAIQTLKTDMAFQMEKNDDKKIQRIYDLAGKLREKDEAIRQPRSATGGMTSGMPQPKASTGALTRGMGQGGAPAVGNVTPPKQPTTGIPQTYKDVPTATNPTTGEQRYWDGTEWIPLTYNRR